MHAMPTCWSSAKRPRQTTGRISELRRSIELDRSVPDPYRKLSEIYEQLRMHALSKQVLAEYLKVMPQNITQRRAQLGF